MGMFKKPWSAARRPSRTESLQPSRLNVEGENERPRAREIMNIGMRLPPVDKDRNGIGKRMDAVANDELGIRAFYLEQDVTMRVRMPDQRAVHVEQGDPAEIAVYDTQGSRHSSLPVRR